MSALIQAAWRYRGFIRSSVANEFRTRVARSRFGTAWIVLQPLAQALMYAVILSNVLSARLPGAQNRYAFAVYLLSGLLCWSLFAEIVQRCTTIFIDSASLMKKMSFPRICLPLIVVGSSLVSNLALLLIILLIIPILGLPFTVNVLWLPLLILITVAMATGVGLLLGTLNVFARDIGQVMVVVMQFWFWMTPIAYPDTILPVGLTAFLAANPMTPLVGGYHDALVHGRSPGMELLLPVAVAMIALALALFVFRRASAEMVDAL